MENGPTITMKQNVEHVFATKDNKRKMVIEVRVRKQGGCNKESKKDHISLL